VDIEQQATPQAIVQHKTSFLRIFVLLIFALAIAVLSSLGTYWYISSKTIQPNLQQTYQVVPTVQPTVSVSQTNSKVGIANWKTYVNNQLNFSLAYPSNFEINDRSVQFPPLNVGIGTSEPNSGYILIQADKSQESLAEYINNPTHNLTYLKTLSLASNNYMLAKATNDAQDQMPGHSDYFIKSGNYILDFTNITLNTKTPISGELFEQILTTFKLTN